MFQESREKYSSTSILFVEFLVIDIVWRAYRFFDAESDFRQFVF
jgi:hypothetical protein